MRGRLGIMSLACCALAAATLHAYEGPDYKLLKAFLPPGPDAALCFTRTYDQAHLKRHPQQKVTEMTLSLRYVHLSDEDAILVATDRGGTIKQDFRYDFTLAAKTRDRRETLYASGDCASWKEIGCGVDCDGGGISIEPAGGDKTQILVRLERIRMSKGCSEGDDVDLDGGADDKVFKLSRAPQTECDAMDSEASRTRD